MEIIIRKFNSKLEMYDYICEQVPAVCEKTDSIIAKLANFSSLINLFLEEINWVGFYFLEGNRLVLGPFQGKPAVTEIEIGSGVCGTAAMKRETQLIENVHECTNHIACDISSMSEIVVPMVVSCELFGVLDIDSPLKSRFDKEDKVGLEKLVDVICKSLFN